MTGDTAWVAGVDGCPAGWIVVLRNTETPIPPRVEIAADFASVLAIRPKPAIIAIDIPIGIPDFATGAGRGCDVAARTYLGNRRSSVFAVPARAAVLQTDYRDACDLAFENSDPPRKVSKQSFNIFPKIRDVDSSMTPALQNRVIECHPEVAFTRLNNNVPLSHAKRQKPHGPDERIRLLSQAGFDSQFLTTQHTLRKHAAADDFLDACVCSWVAERRLNGKAVCLPSTPERDGRGLEMAIWS